MTLRAPWKVCSKRDGGSYCGQRRGARGVQDHLFGTVAGCMITDGYVKRANPIRLIRDGIVVYAASCPR